MAGCCQYVRVVVVESDAQDVIRSFQNDLSQKFQPKNQIPNYRIIGYQSFLILLVPVVE
jgi:hypothetical protein